MGRISCFLLAAVGLACLIAGCSLHRPAVRSELPSADIELTTVPFFPQKEYQCGPAALATLLVSSDVVTLPDLLSPRLYIPQRKGSLQLELVAAIRSYERIPYQIKPGLDPVRAELRAGRPVLVLQNLGLSLLPVYHYAVVIGMQQDGSVILRSGTTERLIMAGDEFLASWEKAGGWGIVSLKAGELPADQDLANYLQAVARVEETGNTRLAGQCYTAVLQRYPSSEPALFGLANTMYAQRNFTAAAAYYSHLLRRNPRHAAAANNLAETLAALHCYRTALELLDRCL